MVLSAASKRDISDPTIVGPGVWHTLFVEAFWAREPEQQQAFIDFVHRQADNFPCSKCQNHWKEYINNHPLERFLGVKTEEGLSLGMFIWTWMFKNAVNYRLGDPPVSWDTAYNYYANNDEIVCSSKCQEAEKAASTLRHTLGSPLPFLLSNAPPKLATKKESTSLRPLLPSFRPVRPF